MNKQKYHKNFFINFIKGGLIILISVLIIYGVVQAGNIIPPSGLPTAQFYTLSDIYKRLNTNETSIAGDHSFTFFDPLINSGWTLTDIYNAIPTINSIKLLDDTTYLGVTGTIPNKVDSATIFTPSISDQAITQGYYGGALGDGKVLGDANLVVGNIAKDVNIFGVVGTAILSLGDAVAGNVLADKYFSNATTSNVLGTMTNKVDSATIFTPSISDQAITQGYYGGALGDGKVLGSANLISSNIKSGVNIFGVNGNFSGSYGIPKTGQQPTRPTGAPFLTGDDAFYANPAGEDIGYPKGKLTWANYNTTRFSENENQIITDNATGLMWIKAPQLIIPGNPINASNKIETARGNWAIATSYNIADLVYAIETEVSAVTATRSGTTVTADTANTFTAEDVGRTIVFTGGASSRILIFTNGTTVTVADSVTDSTPRTFSINSFYISAVAHTSGDITFTADIIANPTYWRETFWTNSASNLTTPSQRAWLNSVNDCENLNYANYLNWRLPNVKELQSIVDYGRWSPSIDSVFTNTQLDGYWSSTTVANNTIIAWHVSFYYGDVYSNTKTPSYYARCVRE